MLQLGHVEVDPQAEPKAAGPRMRESRVKIIPELCEPAIVAARR